nr:bro-g [Mamestra configurata nucleopolyhedrovirus A]
MALSIKTFNLDNKPVEVNTIKEDLDNGKIQFWFDAKEFANCMGYKQPDIVIKRINQKYLKKFEHLCHQSTTGVHPHTVFVNESGLYQMALSSKPKNNRVKLFKKWVSEEVFPKIDGLFIQDAAEQLNNSQYRMCSSAGHF